MQKLNEEEKFFKSISNLERHCYRAIALAVVRNALDELNKPGIIGIRASIFLRGLKDSYIRDVAGLSLCDLKRITVKYGVKIDGIN